MAIADPTVNFAWDLPTNGGSSGSWGTMLNTIIGDTVTGIDAVVNAVSEVADAALARAGGTMTGLLEILTDQYVTVNSGSLTGAKTFDLATSRFFYGTVTGNTTFTFSNPPTSGKFVAFVLELTNPGAFTITWPAAVKWPGGAAPGFTASGVDVVSLYTRDGGTTWRATRGMEASA